MSAKASLSESSSSRSSNAVYEAGSTGTRRTLTWRAPQSSPNHAVLGTLTTLRNRSRAAVRNNGYPKATIDKLVTNIIGTGITPLSKAVNQEIRKQLDALWLRWTDESDADGLLDFYGQEAQVTRGFLEGGEIFVRKRPRFLSDGLSVPIQFQVLEPELCPHTHNLQLGNGNKIRAGIEFDRIGRRRAYYFHPSRPGDLLDYDPGQLVRIPAESILHVFEPLRPGQIRGLPLLTQSLIRFHELDKFDDAVLLRQQVSNLFAGFIKRELEEGEKAVNPLTGENLDESEQVAGEAPALTLEPGVLQQLEPGEDVNWSEPPETGQGYKDFMAQQLRAACASNGVPYELVTGDMAGLNDRLVRVILNEFTSRLEATQHHTIVFQFCRPARQAWLDAVVLSGAVAIPDDYLTDHYPYSQAAWMPPKRRYIHPVQEVEADVMAIESGLTSRRRAVASRGDDIEQIDQENADDNERADRLGLEYTSDAREPEPEASTGAAPAARAEIPSVVRDQPIHIDVDARTTIEAGAIGVAHHAAPVNITTPEVNVDARTHVDSPTVTIAEGAVKADVAVSAPAAPRQVRKTVQRDASGLVTGVIEEQE